MTSKTLTRYLVTFQEGSPKLPEGMPFVMPAAPIQALLVEAESRVQAVLTFYQIMLINGHTLATEDLNHCLDPEEREQIRDAGLPLHPGRFNVQAVQVYRIQPHGRLINFQELNKEYERQARALGAEPVKALPEPKSFLEEIVEMFGGRMVEGEVDNEGRITFSEPKLQDLPAPNEEETWYEPPAQPLPSSPPPSRLPSRRRAPRKKPKE
jgi:hypothetical protein